MTEHAAHKDARVVVEYEWSGQITGKGSRVCNIEVIGRGHQHWDQKIQMYKTFVQSECAGHFDCCFANTYLDKACESAHFLLYSVSPCAHSRLPFKKRRQIRQLPTTGRPSRGASPHFVVSAVLTVLYSPSFEAVADERIDKFYNENAIRTRRRQETVQSVLGTPPPILYIDFICSTANRLGYINSTIQIIKEIAAKHQIGIIALRAMGQTSAFLTKYYGKFGFKEGLVHALDTSARMALPEGLLNDGGDMFMSCRLK